MDKPMEVTQLGEFGLIKRISQKFTPQRASSLVGIGDDAAVIEMGGQEVLLLSTDMLTEGIHFDLSYAPLKHLGYKAVTVNVSDIAAMNGVPEQITMGIALSNRFSVAAIDELYEGVRLACTDYKVDLVGGDTTTSLSGLALSLAVLGRATKACVAYRSGMQPNDILCVSGDLGAAYVGLQILEREKQVFLANPEMQPALDKFEYMVGRQLKPMARTDIVHELATLGVKPTAMIDISDGLTSELMHLSAQSGVGVRIFEEKLPIDNRTYEAAVVDLKMDPLICALHGGEDYELLFSIRQADFEKVKNHPDIHFIGHAHDNALQNVLVSSQGTVVPLQAQGWRSPALAPRVNG